MHEELRHNIITFFDFLQQKSQLPSATQIHAKTELHAWRMTGTTWGTPVHAKAAIPATTVMSVSHNKLTCWAI